MRILQFPSFADTYQRSRQDTATKLIHTFRIFKNYTKISKDEKNNILRKYFNDIRQIDDFMDYLVKYLSIDNV